MARTAWTRVWTMMPRGCGVRTSSRASRRRWRSTPPAAGGKSSSRMRARCTVSIGDRAARALHRAWSYKPGLKRSLLPRNHVGGAPPTPKAPPQAAGSRAGGGDPCPLGGAGAVPSLRAGSPSRALPLSAVPDRQVWWSRSREAGSGHGSLPRPSAPLPKPSPTAARRRGAPQKKRGRGHRLAPSSRFWFRCHRW